ncbi:MAG TPA: carboxypeptidase-like regulatory domain-containing protein [Asanoa sp.]|nr:carboxypeptidase-like regulatory domain-containing protein [Asanoa sp.]
MSIISFSNGTLSPGQSATVRFRVTNTNPGNAEQTATIKVSSSFGELSCVDGCDSDEQVSPNDPQVFEARLTAGNVADGQSKSGQVIVQATINGEGGQATRNVTVRGKQVQAPPPVQTIKSISGKVTSQGDGKGVSGAYVALSDGASKLHETLANASGNFTFSGTAQDPIAPGQITIGASKDDKRNTKTVNLNAGQSANGVVIQLPLAAAEPSVSATPLVPTEAPDEATDDATASDSAIAAAPAGNADDGGGFGNWLVVLGGGLLVAFGVGGIIWVMLRRKENDDPDDETSTTGVRPAVPAGGAAGYRGGNDATRIAGAGGGGLADAPTMLHNRAPMDEFPDPYGAPMPPQAPTYGGGAQTQPGWGGAGGYGEPPTRAGYDQQTQMYNPAPGSGGGYGAAGGYPDAPGSGSGGYGGAPASGGGYGGQQPGGGYPAAGGGYGERFDEPTGRYEPASGGDGYGGQPNGGYPQQGGAAGGYGGGQGYGAEPNGYGAEPNGDDGDNAGRQSGGYGGQRGGYDQGRGGYEGGGYGGAPSAGYDQGQPAGGYPAGGYDPAQGGGYEQGGGYPQGGGGYDRVPEQRGGGEYTAPNGRGDQADYYPDENDGRGARHGAEGGRDRRQLGWLDD